MDNPSKLLTPVAAGILAIGYANLSMTVVRCRQAAKVPVGDGTVQIIKALADKDKPLTFEALDARYFKLRNAIRAHANFGEYGNMQCSSFKSPI